MEGDEFALKYFHSDRLVFAYSTMPPGGKSAFDPGHVGADEVVYVVKGQILIQIGDKGDFVNLREGDAALIEDSVPHTVYNPGPAQAEMTWSTAPVLGRADRLTGD
ncbi:MULTISPECIES: cupin domain-containing protein [unclassified Nonomuraea]|uniref:cupin domain-containing protein n=1 Tax=unclassified Nonomuraea TaxID=2593643 RepID=UPI0033DE19A5